MQLATKVSVGIAAAGMLFWGLTSTAFADGEYSPAQEAPAEEGRKFTWSITLAGTSDYIFRGLSLSNEDPAFQPAINFGYGIFYVGAWGSNLYSPDVAGPWETDFYAGIKPVWGPVTFDFGTVYYTYFGQEVDSDYIEFKAGASFSPFTNFTVTPIFWWTPSQSNYDETWTIEGTVAYALPACGIFTPTISGLLGYTEDTEGTGAFGGAADNYTYWNAGLALAVEKFTFDFRYWDTNLDSVQGDGYYGLDDERFVFTASVTLP
jgi:uncharacterized protein (TIGR02001 family)